MKRFIVLFLGCCCLPAFAADTLDSLLHVQRARAGECAEDLFKVVESATAYAASPQELSDLRFLVACLPLSDLASVRGEMLLENVRLAHQARDEFAWGLQVPPAIFRHFVLPHRVTQEPYVDGWRRMFHDELAPRVRNLSMTEAALEVNHWCHEHATYQPSDSRDQDPLTTIRAGLGRCEEEMILAICALRSVGIPARQCYTPYWPHMDDNHAWVEVWTDGKWHYFGACEPDVALDRAWFTAAASRAMLVVSTSYGDYQGDEPVLRRAGRTTLINSTAVYGPTHRVNVRLEDHRGRPLPKANVVFSLFNYGAIVPAISLETDSVGKVTLTCGLGDWFVSAGKGEWAVFKHITAADTNVVLRLQHPDSLRTMTSVEFTPPPAIQKSDTVTQDSLFACRLENEDRIRESLWGTWVREAGLAVDSSQWKPDSLLLGKLASENGIRGAEMYTFFAAARGNWGNLYRFLFTTYPEVEVGGAEASYRNGPRGFRDWVSRGGAHGIRARWQLLCQLTEKDRRDFTTIVLYDHVAHMTLAHRSMEGYAALKWIIEGEPSGGSRGESPEVPGMTEFTESLDSTTRERYEKYVVAPRIDKEPSRAWRGALFDFLKANKKLIASDGDKRMTKWLRKNIIVDKDRDRLGPPLTPAECLELRRGTPDDVERLYVGLCRVREIPARFDPVSNRLQRWENDAWLSVDLGVREKRKESSTASGFLTMVPADSDSTTLNTLYNREWAVQMWDGDRFSDVDFGFQVAFKDQTWPKPLPVGLYCLTSGVRRKDGSVPLRMSWVEVRRRGEASVTLSFESKEGAAEP